MQILRAATVVASFALLTYSCNSSSPKKKSAAAPATQCVPDPNYNAANSTGSNGTFGSQGNGNNTLGSNTGFDQSGNTGFDQGSNTQNSSTLGNTLGLVDEGTAVTWSGTIKAIIDQKCISCHATNPADPQDQPAAGVDLTNYPTSTDVQQNIVSTVNIPVGTPGIMPPANSPQLTEQEKQAFNNWQTNQYAQGLPTGNDGSQFPNGSNQSGFGQQQNQQQQQNFNSSNVSSNCPPGMMDATAANSANQQSQGTGQQFQQGNTQQQWDQGTNQQQQGNTQQQWDQQGSGNTFGN